MFHVKLLAGESLADYPPARCIELVRRGAGDQDLLVDVIRALEWTMGAQISDRFAVGRIVLTGDAAHRTTPDGGVGMKTAVQSAHNLASTAKVSSVAARSVQVAWGHVHELVRGLGGVPG
jgi:2-polyprenyl-6-methoxyphenol hydroxylase-like FAD-dependent oxidoreductase